MWQAELESYFKEDVIRGRKMVDLYQAVQHAPEIIPRIYLLITVGSVYIQSHEEGSHKILADIIEMLKAVQNPLRGLFLRYYYLKMCKERLPDTGSGYETEGYGVQQAIEIIHTNLKESTNLWMRIGAGRDKDKRKKEKNDLKMLIGENLMRISSLEGVNIRIYKQVVLPKMLELIQWTKDAMSQEYLLDCMIQGFPEEFHINTLPELLNTCAKECEKEMDMKAIFIALMNRLSNYLSDSGNVIENIENGFSVYELFALNIAELVRKSEASELKNTLNLYSAFLQFTLKCYPTKHEYVNQILLDASNYCSKYETGLDEDCQLYISRFLIQPLDSMASLILSMKEYPKLMKYLKFKRRREVAKNIAKSIAKGTIDLTDDNLVAQLLSFIEPLLLRQPDYEDVSELVFKDEQTQVAKMVFQVASEEVPVVWAILKKFIDKFVQGGDERMRYTVPSTVFRLLQLAVQMSSQEDLEPKAYKKIFELVRNLIDRIKTTQPVLSVKLYLELILLINKLDSSKFYDEYTYETAAELLLIYEEQITESKMRKQLLEIIINSLVRLTALSDENYDTLVSNTTSFCSKILKKNEQCEILLSCCFLFTNPLADASRIHEVLKRCTKLAKTCVEQSPTNLGLYMSILDSYLFFVRQKEIIHDNDHVIPDLVALVDAKLKEDPPQLAALNNRWAELTRKISQ